MPQLQRSNTVTALLLAVAMVVPSALAAQSYKAVRSTQFSGQSVIDLPFIGAHLFAGPSGQVMVMGADTHSVIAIDLLQGASALSMTTIGTPVIGTATSEGDVAVISDTGAGEFVAEVMPSDREQITWSQPLNGFKEPTALFVTLNGGTKAEEKRLLIWDKAPDQVVGRYLLAGPNADDSVYGNDLPAQFLPIASGDNLLGLQPASHRATVIDVRDAELSDAVSLDAAGYKASNSLAVFVPDAPRGGTGGAVVANTETNQLALIVATPGTQAQLVQVLQIPLPNPTGPKGRWTDPLIAGDRDLQFIVLGAVGSDRLQIIRRLKGGLDVAETIRVDFALGDLTAISVGGQGTPDVFVFLSADGTQLLVSDIATLEGRIERVQVADLPNTVDPGSPEFGSSERMSAADILRLQRTLAALGYQVGALDGVAGPQTVASLRAFQVDQKLDPSGTLDADTATALNRALTSGVAGASLASSVAAFDDFINAALGVDFDGAQLMQLGESQSQPDHPCFGLNSLPPEQLWPNAVKFAGLLHRLTSDGTLKIRVVGGYETAAVSRCLGRTDAQARSDFLSFDIVPDGISDLESPAAEAAFTAIESAIDALRVRGLTTVSFSRENGVLHVEPMIGESVAAIATYDATPEGCAMAKDDIDEFTRLLAGSNARGREIFVARQGDLYVVVVDFNSNRRVAALAVGVIRLIGASKARNHTGYDALLLTKPVFFDPACARMNVIPKTRGDKG